MKSQADRELEKSLLRRFDRQPGKPQRIRKGTQQQRDFHEAGKEARGPRARGDKRRDQNILRERAEGVSVAALSAKYLVARGTIRQLISRARKAGKFPASPRANPDPGPNSPEAGKGLGPYLGAPNGSGEDLRGAAYRRAAAIGRQYMANALLRLVEVAELDQIDEHGRLLPLSARADRRVVIVAVRDYLNRVFGSQPIKDPEILEPTRARFDPSLYSREELAQIEQTLRLVAAAQAKAENDL